MHEEIEWRAPYVVPDQDSYFGRCRSPRLLDGMDGQPSRASVWK